MDDVFDGYGVAIELNSPQDFLRVKETLTRIGYPDSSPKTLFQSCHIFHKRGRYAIMHFKEMAHFDGKMVSISETDVIRRNSITKLLEQWNLLKIISPIETPFNMKDTVVVHFRDKKLWNLRESYSIGKVK